MNKLIHLVLVTSFSLLLFGCPTQETQPPLETLFDYERTEWKISVNGELLIDEFQDEFCSTSNDSRSIIFGGPTSGSVIFVSEGGYRFPRHPIGGNVHASLFLIGTRAIEDYFDVLPMTVFPKYVAGELISATVHPKVVLEYDSGERYASMIFDFIDKRIDKQDTNSMESYNFELIESSECGAANGFLMRVEHEYQGYAYNVHDFTDSVFLEADLLYNVAVAY